MKLLATIVPALLLVLLAIGPSAAQQPRDSGFNSADDAEPLRPERARPRTKLRVRPAYPYRHYHSLYPVPYPVEYPGPNAKRECVARYVTEHRPSGTVIVPRMRCWWVRG